jgi:ubiquinol-cytochrome c reductase iron-sulfur subunit
VGNAIHLAERLPGQEAGRAGAVSPGRRRVLVAATGVVGTIGLGLAAWPFIASMEASARTRAEGGPVQVDVSRLELGQRLTVQWRGKPVWILRRDARMLESLREDEALLRDPDSQVDSQQPRCAQNRWRSIEPQYLVLVGLCTHLGCSPLFRPTPDGEDLGSSWPGGFFCPCHGSRFDLAGRVFNGVPAPLNMLVPPYRYASKTEIIVGADSRKA